MPGVSSGQRQALARSAYDGIGGKLPQLKPTDHYLVKGMHEKNRVGGLKIAGLGPGNRRFNVRESGRAEFRLQRRWIAVIIMYGKLHLPAGPWHDHMEEPDKRAEGQQPGQRFQRVSSGTARDAALRRLA